MLFIPIPKRPKCIKGTFFIASLTFHGRYQKELILKQHFPVFIV